MKLLGSDVAFALRHLRHNPTFSIVAVLTLVLAIGANATVFSVVDALLRFPQQIGDPERVAFVFSQNAEKEVAENGLSMDDFLDLEGVSRSFSALVLTQQRRVNLVGSGEPVRLQALEASPGLFRVLEAPIALGRGFEPADAQPGAPRVAVLTFRVWQDRFDGRTDVLGETLSIDGEATAIVGVAAESVRFPSRENALFLPLTLERGAHPRDARDFFALGRLSSGVSSEAATAEAETVFARLAAEHPESNRGWGARVDTARENFLQDVDFALTILYGSISLVLLIACANVASLLLARASAREREIALRRALGAGRLRVVRQLLTESLVLALIGGGGGLLLGTWGMRVLRSMLAADVNVGDIAADMRLSPTFVLHTLAAATFAALVFGVLPALRMSRPSLAPALREGGRGGSGGAQGKALRGALVAAEVAMALALLGTTGATMRAFERIYEADPGFDPAGLLTADLALVERDYPEPNRVVDFLDRAQARLAEVPGVNAATFTSALPLTGRPGRTTVHLAVEGGGEDEGAAAAPNAIDVVVGPGFFDVLGVPLVDGRAFAATDGADDLPVAVVSRATAERFWPEGGALGRRFRLGGEDAPWRTVVGVVDNVQLGAHSLRFPNPTVPEVFLPHTQQPPRAISFLLRAGGDPLALAGELRQAVWSIDPRQPIDRVLTLEQAVDRIDTQNRFFLRVLSGLSTVALVLAAVGIYGIVAFATGQRRQEIGIRVALGARPASIIGLVVRQAVVLTVIGLILGLAVAIVFVKLMSAELAGMAAAHAGGPMTFLAVAGVFLVVAQLAGYLPARRAVKADPVKALRME